MWFRFILLAAGLLWATGPQIRAGDRGMPSPQKAPTYVKDVRPLLEKHCFTCHGADRPRGGVNLSAFAGEELVRRQRKVWLKVVEQIEAQEMPPAGRAPLSDGQRTFVTRWIRETLENIGCGDAASRNPGPACIRRLSRSEYNHTSRDLLGINIDTATAVGMPADAVGAGFDNLANALNVAPTLLEKYFAAADKALEEVKKNRKAHDTLYLARPGNDLPAREAARRILTRFVRRAYRRPLRDGEIDRLLRLFDRAEAGSDRFEDALRLPLRAVLVSPHFLFRIEEDRAPPGSVQNYRVSDHELAVRLSYFLWSSLPDFELARLADEGKLSDPEVRERQVRRMLADPKAHALTENFAAQWLQIRKLPEARPSTEFFPTFTPQLRQAMYDEAATFFDKLRAEDRSLFELLDADYTYVNEELAKHYGLAAVKGRELRRVELKPGDHRGGVLGMGAMLALTSHTSRTSPTLRGKWVLEVIFGTPPDPPPPDAGMLKEEHKPGAEPKTFREQMALHARRASCAACHKKIDPLGFALEDFDAVGRWRETAGGRPVDNAAQLLGGEKFAGFAGLKRIVLRRKDDFARNFVERLMTYALGRELGYDDECAIREALAVLKKNDYRFSALVLGVVNSFPFQYRRNPGARAEGPD
ncbi:MAG TPA: DUF1592 domain-containing protein [Gemmataceae bacterium]|nr:DUF1592 domain-containing protein [Gemmataceae bacterium]